MIVVISPHADDAALSLGQFIAASDDVIVHTVFAAGPSGNVLSDYDRSCGFHSSRQAMFERRQEDNAAMRELGAIGRFGPFFDAQYGIDNDEDAMRAWLGQMMGPEYLTFVPLGIGHPDHRQVAKLARDALPIEPEIRGLCAYEELPSRVEHPELVSEAMDEWRADGFTFDTLPLPLVQGPRERKRVALSRYRSQDLGRDEPMFYCPERCWRAIR